MQVKAHNAVALPWGAIAMEGERSPGDVKMGDVKMLGKVKKGKVKRLSNFLFLSSTSQLNSHGFWLLCGRLCCVFVCFLFLFLFPPKMNLFSDSKNH